MRTSMPVGPIGTALVLVAALAGAASGDLITNAGAIPNPFSPNGDGVFDETVVYYTLALEADVKLTVRNADLDSLDVLSIETEEPGQHSHAWDGTVDGSVPPDGDYYVRIEADPLGGPPETVDVPCTIDTQPPVIADLVIAPSRFSPDGDGVGDSLLVSFVLEEVEVADHTTVDVTNLDDELVASLLDETGVETVEVYWNGIDAIGEAAGDTLYVVDILARDAAGNATEDGALVDLDTSPPLLRAYIDPSEGAFVDTTSVITVAGRVYDRAGVVEMEISTNGETWEPLAFSDPDSLPIFRVRWEATVSCTTCAATGADETMTVRVRGRDGSPTASGQGYVNTETTSNPILTFDVVFDVEGPVHDQTVIADDDAIYRPGDTITIDTAWDEEGYGLTANFDDVDSQYDPANLDTTDYGTGAYRLRYTISSGSTIVTADEELVITVTDRFGRPAEADPVTVTVVPVSGTPSDLRVSENAFNPLAGTDDDVTITVGSDAGGIKVEIYNVAGSLVRKLDSEGEPSVTWNGENDGGEIVASGVYFLRIRTNVDDVIRKVAVVK